MQTCYVCSTNVDTEIDKYCFRDEEDGSTGYRHFWHGVPGIRHTAPSAGIQGYAMSLEDAKKRAEEFNSIMNMYETFKKRVIDGREPLTDSEALDRLTSSL